MKLQVEQRLAARVRELQRHDVLEQALQWIQTACKIQAAGSNRHGDLEHATSPKKLRDQGEHLNVSFSAGSMWVDVGSP